MIPSPKSTSNNLFCSFCEMNARGDTVSVALMTEEKSKMSCSSENVNKIKNVSAPRSEGKSDKSAKNTKDNRIVEIFKKVLAVHVVPRAENYRREDESKKNSIVKAKRS